MVLSQSLWRLWENIKSPWQNIVHESLWHLLSHVQESVSDPQSLMLWATPLLSSLENISSALITSFLPSWVLSRQIHTKAPMPSPLHAILRTSHQFLCIFPPISSLILLKFSHLISVFKERHMSALLYHYSYSMDEGKIYNLIQRHHRVQVLDNHKTHISENITATSVLTHCCTGEARPP